MRKPIYATGLSTLHLDPVPGPLRGFDLTGLPARTVADSRTTVVRLRVRTNVDDSRKARLLRGAAST